MRECWHLENQLNQQPANRFPKVDRPMNSLSPAMQEWLSSYVRSSGAVAGTVHLRHGDGLALAAAINIPPPVADAVRYVPWGKGMAGMALETGEAVQTCNLKEDEKIGRAH